MFCQLLFVSIFLFCLVGCVFGRHVSGNENKIVVVVDKTAKDAWFLKEEEINKAMLHNKCDAENKASNFKNIYNFPFVTSDDLLTALAKVNGAQNYFDDMELMSKCSSPKGTTHVTDATNNCDYDTNKDTTHDDIYTRRNNIVYPIKDMIAVTIKNKIYFLMVNASEPSNVKKQWDFVFFEEIVTKSSGNSLNYELKTIKLSNKLIDNQFKEKIQDKFPYFVYASVTTEGNVVFVVGGIFNNDNKEGNVFSIFLLKNYETESELVHIADTTANCRPTFFLWGNKMVIVSTDLQATNDQKITEIDLTEKKLSDNEKLFTYLLSTFKNKKNIISVNIDQVPVLLFTEERRSEEGGVNVYLWMTDGNHTIKVGNVISEIKDKFTSPIYYYNKKLFLSYCQNIYLCGLYDNHKEIIAGLEKQKEKISTALVTWKKNNNKILELFKRNNVAKISFYTDRLVGFLSGNDTKDNKSVWRDEYLYMDATVTGGERVPNGFKFNSPGAGAKWPVGNNKEKNDQPYNFIKYGLTVMATVAVEQIEVNQEISLLGVCMEGDNKCVELWCTNKGDFVVKNKQRQTEMDISTDVCRQNESFKIVIMLQEEQNVVIYTYGDKIDHFSTNGLKIDQTDNISHIYFGAVTPSKEEEKKAVSHVTVTNVLLYNRLFTAEEIEELTTKKSETILQSPEKKESEALQSTGSEDGILQTPEAIQFVTNETINTSNTTINTKENTSLMLHLRDGVVFVGVDVFSLLLAVWTVLLCVP